MVELTWDGKYDAHGKRTAPLRLKLPFQTVETVNESAQQRQMAFDLFSTGRPAAWRNRLIWGDKKYVLPALLDEFAGQVDLIYIDPPFATGADFSFQVQVEDERFTKEASIIEQKAYRDTWGRGLDSYLQWFYETAVLLHELLCETGSLYVHLDYHVAHYAKCLLDEVFGSDAFDSEIVWKRKDAQSSADTYGNAHDTIFFYRKSKSGVFNKQYVPLSDETIGTWYKHEESLKADIVNRKGQTLTAGTIRRFNKADISAPGLRLGTEAHYQWKGHWPPSGRHWAYRIETMRQLETENRLTYSNSGRVYEKRYLDESTGVPAQSLWTDISFLRGMTKRQAGSEWADYPTQKPEALLERIINSSSNENDLILDCFCGSGTTATVAEKLNRRWITCDLGRFAIHTTRKRLLSIPNVKPFVVQNLGKYERQAWQVAEFGSAQQAAAITRQYRHFILDLYHARPIDGYTWLHGVKEGRMVHVGAVDAPISPSDITSIATEFRKSIGTGQDAPKIAAVDVLGWDFAFELNEIARQQAAQANITLRFLRIPREVLEQKAVDQGDIHFFELAALAVDLAHKGRDVTLKLTDFVIPPDDVPEDVQRAISHWSQWLDYWAVDWDNKGDTFHNTWQAYRTRQDNTLQLQTTHRYEQPGEYTILVKAIDILGNDTTKTVRVQVV